MKDQLYSSQYNKIGDSDDDEENAARSSFRAHLNHENSVTWTQWLPWILTILLLVTNSYTWNELRAFRIEDAVYCEYSAR